MSTRKTSQLALTVWHLAFLGPQIKALFTEKLKNKIASAFQMLLLEDRLFVLLPLNKHFNAAVWLWHF